MSTTKAPKSSEQGNVRRRLVLALRCTYCQESDEIACAFWWPTGVFMTYVFAAALLAGPILLACATKDISQQQCRVLDCPLPSTADVIVTSLCPNERANTSSCAHYKARLDACAQFANKTMPCFFAGEHTVISIYDDRRVYFHRPYLTEAIVLLSTSWPFVVLLVAWGLYLCAPCLKEEIAQIDRHQQSYNTLA